MILSLCVTSRYDLEGQSSYEAVMNYTLDILEYFSFEWFQWWYHFDEVTKSKQLCRWLGPVHDIGQSFCSYILLDNAECIIHSLVIALLPEDGLQINLKKIVHNLGNQ